MRTKQFCELIEAAMAEEYGPSEFDTVSYIPTEGGDQQQCLGIFLLEEGIHMAVVAARAMYLIWQDNDAVWNTDQEKDEALGDFVQLMAGMHVAPYMQWHCAYFPGLTAEQVLAESEAGEDPVLDMSGTGIEHDLWTAERLFAEFDNLPGVKTMWYSGRGMNGGLCVAIAGTENDCVAIIGTIRERANEATLICLNNLHRDALGHDVVMYFPDFKKGE